MIIAAYVLLAMSIVMLVSGYSMLGWLLAGKVERERKVSFALTAGFLCLMATSISLLGGVLFSASL